MGVGPGDLPDHLTGKARAVRFKTGSAPIPIREQRRAQLMKGNENVR